MLKRAVIKLPKSQRTLTLESPHALDVSLESIQRFVPMSQWLSRLDQQYQTASSKIDVTRITIQSVDMFGSNRIGFVKFNTNTSVPGIVFLRGGSVGILLILRCNDTRYVVLTEQPRMAVPDFGLRELPAGMLDDETGDFVGVAARELYEETGISIKSDELQALHREPLYPSPGACDESMRLFVCHKSITQEQLQKINSRPGGLPNEQIVLRVVPLDQVAQHTNDMKALCALYLYQNNNT